MITMPIDISISANKLTFQGINTILLHFSLSVKAAPHACVIRTNPS